MPRWFVRDRILTPEAVSTDFPKLDGVFNGLSNVADCCAALALD